MIASFAIHPGRALPRPPYLLRQLCPIVQSIASTTGWSLKPAEMQLSESVHVDDKTVNGFFIVHQDECNSALRHGSQNKLALKTWLFRPREKQPPCQAR